MVRASIATHWRDTCLGGRRGGGAVVAVVRDVVRLVVAAGVASAVGAEVAVAVALDTGGAVGWM